MSAESTLILGEAQIDRTIRRLACEVVERNRGLGNVLIVGIERRGTALARRLTDVLSELQEARMPVHALDVHSFRDDIEQKEPGSPPPFSVDGRDVVLVDDVLYTGRTVRAALDAIVQAGRPASIQLLVLVDRGHREYPIRPDFVGREIETAYRSHVRVDVESPMGIHIIED
jgi:pyrimidine operon attenuation protein / uracil phosphoribosyltransferase